MAQNNSLSPIVVEVDGNTVPSESWKKRVILDDSGAILPKKPAFLSFSNVKYYVVSNSSQGLFTEHSTSNFEIEDFGKNRSISISIVSKVGCFAGSEDVFVKSLVFGKHAPGLALNDFIRDWIFKFVGDHSDQFIDGFFRNQNGEKLLNQIRENAREIGVVFQQIRYELAGPEYLKTKNVEISKLETTFEDSTEKYLFSIKATLPIDEDNKINAVATHLRDSELESIVNAELKEYFPNHVAFERFESSQTSVENEIKIHLNRIFTFYGRKVGAIQIKVKDAFDAPKTIDKSFPISITAPEYPEPIKIESQILVKRQDIAKFINNKPENFEEWLKIQFENAVKSAFFGQRYSEIKEKFEEIKIKIREELRNTVFGVGYELEQIIVIPSFQKLNPLEKIEIKIENTFITLDQEQVNLKVDINFAIKTLGKISHYVDHDQLTLLEKDLKSLCSNEITQYIHSVKVGEFHGNFEEPEEGSGKLSVKKILSSLIEEKAAASFGAQISYIFFDRGEDEVIQKMNDLKKVGWTSFKAEIQSFSDYGKSIISGSFLVESGNLELWQIFRTQDITMEKIKGALENELSSKLSDESSTFITYKNAEWHEKINSLVSEIATKSIKENYGINIKVSSVSRELQDYEKSMKEIRDAILQKITQSSLERLDAVETDDWERVEIIDRRLHGFREEIGKLKALPEHSVQDETN